MPALIIIFCIALFIALLLSTKIILRIKYEETLVVYLRILFVKIRLYPKKEKKKRYPHSMSRRKARKIRKSLTKKKKSVKKKDKEKSKEKSKKEDKYDILSIISIITTFVKNFLKMFVKSARIKTSKLHIIVASENAAKTAILFGAVTQATNVLFPLLDSIKTFKKLPKGKDLSVETDFLVDKPSIKADITIYIRVGGILKAAIVAGLKAFKKAVADQLKEFENKR